MTEEPEPRIVQGQIGPITAEELLNQMAGRESQDEDVAALKKQIADCDAILDQYHKLLVDIRDASSVLSETLSMLVDNLKERR